MTLAEFRVLYPEYRGATDALAQAHLDQETAATQGEMTDADRDLLVGLRTADTLAFSPFARDLKLVNKDGSSTYSKRLKQALTKVTIHRRFA